MKKNTKLSKTTKQDILNVAERLFKIHGYENTTFEMIATELGITNGAIAYHYKNKRWILFRFFQQFVDLLSAYIIQNLPEQDPNYFLATCIVNIFFYRGVMRNERNWNLFYTKDNPMIAAAEYLQRKEENYIQITKDFHTNLSDEEIHFATIIENIVKMGLYEEFNKLDDSMTADKFCYYDNLSIGLFLGLDSRITRENISRAFAYADSHNPPSIFLLD